MSSDGYYSFRTNSVPDNDAAFVLLALGDVVSAAEQRSSCLRRPKAQPTNDYCFVDYWRSLMKILVCEIEYNVNNVNFGTK